MSEQYDGGVDTVELVVVTRVVVTGLVVTEVVCALVLFSWSFQNQVEPFAAFALDTVEGLRTTSPSVSCLPADVRSAEAFGAALEVFSCVRLASGASSEACAALEGGSAFGLPLPPQPCSKQDAAPTASTVRTKVPRFLPVNDLCRSR